MTEQIVAESAPCPSKTGRGTRKIGKKSGAISLTAPGIAAKAVQSIPIAAPATANPIPSPEAASSSPSPTSTMTPGTTTPATCAPGVNAAMSPMTENNMPELAEKLARSLVTTASRRSLTGKRPSHNDLMRVLRNQNDDLGLQLHQITMEAYKPAMDACKLYLEIYGSGSPNFYMTRNKQVAAACQMNGINDPGATRKQRLASATCYEMIHESITRCIELGLSKQETKNALNGAIEKAAEFFGLGNKKAVKARGKAK